MVEVACAEALPAPARVPFVSVVVPVFGTDHDLVRCLAALESQTYDRRAYEVVVVDNGAEVPGLHLAGFPHVRVVRGPEPGSYAARNRGVARARGAVIAFTDADCTPAADWLERGVAALQAAPGCGLAAGRIELFPRDPARPTLTEAFEGLAGFRQREYVERWRFGATANLFTFRSVFDDVGHFQEGLRSLGDREWGARVAGAGYGQVYVDDARVLHPARRSLARLLRRAARMAGGFYDLARGGHCSWRALARDAPMGLLPRWRGRAAAPAWARRRWVPATAVAGLVVAVRGFELARRLLGGEARRS